MIIPWLLLREFSVNLFKILITAILICALLSFGSDAHTIDRILQRLLSFIEHASFWVIAICFNYTHYTWCKKKYFDNFSALGINYYQATKYAVVASLLLALLTTQISVSKKVAFAWHLDTAEQWQLVRKNKYDDFTYIEVNKKEPGAAKALLVSENFVSEHFLSRESPFELKDSTWFMALSYLISTVVALHSHKRGPLASRGVIAGPLLIWYFSYYLNRLMEFVAVESVVPALAGALLIYLAIVVWLRSQLYSI